MNLILRSIEEWRIFFILDNKVGSVCGNDCKPELGWSLFVRRALFSCLNSASSQAYTYGVCKQNNGASNRTALALHGEAVLALQPQQAQSAASMNSPCGWRDEQGRTEQTGIVIKTPPKLPHSKIMNWLYHYAMTVSSFVSVWFSHFLLACLIIYRQGR